MNDMAFLIHTETLEIREIAKVFLIRLRHERAIILFFWPADAGKIVRIKLTQHLWLAYGTFHLFPQKYAFSFALSTHRLTDEICG